MNLCVGHFIFMVVTLNRLQMLIFYLKKPKTFFFVSCLNNTLTTITSY